MAKSIYSILSESRAPKHQRNKQVKRLREALKANLTGRDSEEVITKGQHINYWVSRGFIKNPNLYLGNGFIHCPICDKPTLHYAISKKIGILQDNVLICKECDWGKYGG